MRFQFLLLFAVLAPIGAVFQCDVGNIDDVCIINTSRTYSTGMYRIVGKGSLIIDTSDGKGLWCTPMGCVLDIKLEGAFRIIGNASIGGSSIVIHAKNVTIDALAQINTNGRGNSPHGAGAGLGDGAGHGGNGASCKNDFQPEQGGPAFGLLDLKYPIDAGSPGSGTGHGEGGGIIFINSTGIFELFGVIAAKGTPGSESSGGGSGGSIFVAARDILGDGLLAVDGGSGYSGGGGGRIAVYVPGEVGASAHISGGTSSAPGCQVGGGGGTLWMNSNLRIDNAGCQNDKSAYTPMCGTKAFGTVQFSASNAAAVRIQNGATLHASSSISISTATISCSGSYTLDSPWISMLYDGTTIGSDGDLTINTNGSLGVNQHVSLSTQGSMIINAKSLDIIGTVSSQALVRVIVPDIIFISGLLDASTVILEATTLNIEAQGRIQNENSNCSDVYGPILSCTMSSDQLSGLGVNSVIKTTRSCIMQSNSQLYGGTMALCIGDTLTVPYQAIISSTGGGCPENRGIGAGLVNTGAPGGGGGHGGLGGAGRLNSKISYGGGVYDHSIAPTNTGSGGGDPGGGGGSGGGVVYVEATEVHHDGILTADGEGGGGSVPGENGGGGGSGGAIIMRTGWLDGSGIISVNGGPGGQSGGGGGGGGILRFDWIFNQVFTPPANFTGHVKFGGGYGDRASGGDGVDGGTGIATAPACPAGYGTYLCSSCPVGTYKSNSGIESCTACNNAPSAAIYTNTTEKSPNCAYRCPTGLIMPQCLSPFEYLVYLVGGPAGFIGCVSGAIFLLLAPYWIKRWRDQPSKNDQFDAPLLDDYDDGQPRYTTAIHHLVESSTLSERDLHRHLHRVYFRGTNTPFDPWHMEYTAPHIIADDVHDEPYAQFGAWCNYHCRWTLQDKFVYVLLWIFGGAILEDWLFTKRDEKFQRLRYYVQIEYDYAFLRSYRARNMLNCLRCNATGDRTLAFIDMLEFLEEEKRSGKPSLPTVILFGGSGSYAVPFWLSENDPLVYTVGDYTYRDRVVWLRFIAALNARLRLVSSHALNTTLKPVWELLQYHNQKHFNHAPMPFHLHLGKFQRDMNGRFQLGIAAIEPPKPAPRRRVSAAPADVTGSINDAETRKEAYVREQGTLIWPDGYEQHDIEPNKSKSPIDTNAVVVVNLPYQGTLIEPLLPIAGCSSGRLWSMPTTLFYYITHWLSFNMPAFGKTFMWGTLTTLDLIAELGFVFFTLYEFAEVDPIGCVVSLAILPLYIVVSPLIGISAVMFPRSSYDLPRKFVLTNMAATINAIVALGYSLIISSHVTWKSWIFTPSALVVNKFVLCILMNCYLADFEVESPEYYRSGFDAFKRDRNGSGSSQRSRHSPSQEIIPIPDQRHDRDEYETAADTFDGMNAPFPRSDHVQSVSGFTSLSGFAPPPTSATLLMADSPPSSPSVMAMPPQNEEV